MQRCFANDLKNFFTRTRSMRRKNFFSGVLIGTSRQKSESEPLSMQFADSSQSARRYKYIFILI